MARTVIASKHDNAGPGRVVPVAAPSESEITQILSLKEKCEGRLGIGILLSYEFLRSLDKAGMGAMAFMKGSHCIGFAFFYSFDKTEAEASIFADPDEDQEVVNSSLVRVLMHPL
ncbi:MAG: hypothetical protein ABR986_06225 [Methanomassiliicoccales archaeon]|jgi:hypothetical protein